MVRMMMEGHFFGDRLTTAVELFREAFRMPATAWQEAFSWARSSGTVAADRARKAGRRANRVLAAGMLLMSQIANDFVGEVL